jgi:carboxymethylenebutenolidase
MRIMSNEHDTLTRREFTALSIAAGVLAATGAAAVADGVAGAGGAMVDDDVRVTTPAGVCDAALIHPPSGAWPGAILFTDVFGLRPTMRDMAKRLAAEGYTVLVPNPFYRSTKPPGLPVDLDFNRPAERAKIDALRAPLTPAAIRQDAIAYVDFLDSQPTIDGAAAIGVFGYCMGGPMALRAAAAKAGRIGAAASFHGRGLVTDEPDSPHRLVPGMRARCYIGIAMNDDERQPDAKGVLGDAFRQARLPATIDVYDGCLHGWCIGDTPAGPGKPPTYDAVQAERAWGELLRLYRRARLQPLSDAQTHV